MMNHPKSREEVIGLLEDLYKEGYRYIVRDKVFPNLIVFSLKPKKYRDTESWGYVDPDAQGVLPAYPIKNTDITEIKWTNRTVTLIEAYLTENVN